MKRAQFSAAISLSALWNRYRSSIPTVVILFILVISSGTTDAQSKDRDNPTRLTSNEISGVIDSDSIGNFYYYSFAAGPGEVSITLTVEPGRMLSSRGLGLKTVSFSLFDRNAAEIASKTVSTYDGGGTGQAVERVDIKRRQMVVLGINIPAGSFNNGVGKYRLRLAGAVDAGQDTPSHPIDPDVDAGVRAIRSQRDNTDNPECLPKKGILRVRMKDGSVRRVDLSEAEEITIEH
jgi:hypothetical protein